MSRTDHKPHYTFLASVRSSRPVSRSHKDRVDGEKNQGRLLSDTETTRDTIMVKEVEFQGYEGKPSVCQSGVHRLA